jgi:non-ribosomal peptide synthetase-like protein
MNSLSLPSLRSESGANGAPAPQTLPDNPLSPEPTGFVFDPLRYWANVDPLRTALRAAGITWSYRVVEERTNQIAHALQALGVRPGDRVAFILPRGQEAILLLIAILKTGAAYVPLDSESPPQRVKECLEDVNPVLVVFAEIQTTTAIGEGQAACSLQQLLETALQMSPDEIPPLQPALTGNDLAYIIFTSGTTGRPKGVPITHASLSNFVVGNQEVCIRVRSDDQVLQAFSPASDGHHEEVWPTFLAGATLVVAASREVHSGPELHSFLNEHGVTIISCAPTLLSLVEGDIPTLRRILFGAENLPVTLVQRWWRPGREILNTYGPTEATVGATFGICHPERPITIGKPLPNYFCYLLEETPNEETGFTEGELAIAGIGVASGYFDRPDLSAEKFVPNPFAQPGLNNETMYRTGDRVRRDTDGNLVWLGRIDSQIKIRGHRIELSDIESHLLASPDIKTAVIVPRQNEQHEIHLVALVVVRDGRELDIAALFGQLRTLLPAYMLPQNVEVVDKIPVLPSGKVDRNRCKTLHGKQVRLERELIPPRSDTEHMVLGIWQDIFHSQEISCADDFFVDLGGYSLLASRFISYLRAEKGFTSISVLNIYENPTIRSFAAFLEAQVTPTEPHGIPEFKEVPSGRYRTAKVLQALGILLIYGIQGLLWLGPIITAIYFSDRGMSDPASMLVGLLLHTVSVPAVLLFAIATKWIVGGQFKEGSYPVWGSVFLRWWFVDRVLAIAPVTFLCGTPLAAVYLRLLGAKVGKNVLFDSLDIDCPDMIEIGDDCSFENSAWLRAAEVTQGELHIHPLRIGNGCMVGVRSGVCGGTVLEEGVALRDLTCVTPGTTVPRDEEWVGSPGRKAPQRLLPLYDPTRQPGIGRRRFFAAFQILLVGLLTMLEAIPFLVIAYTLYNRSEVLTEYLLEPLYAVALVLLACAQALLIKWLVIGKLKPGTYPFPGGYWVRKWFADKHLDVLTSIIVPVYDSLFARPWCRALGMKCGPRSEIALPRRMPYDLVELGEESFLASEVSIGMPLRRNGQVTLERTVVGKRAFLGNDSVVPQGSQVPEESLLGVLSVWPTPAETGDRSGQAWLGSPAFPMPNRQVHAEFDVKQTYSPTKRLYAERLLHESLRIILPSFCSLVLASGLIEAFTAIWNETSLPVAVLCSPLLYLCAAFIGAGMCWISKAVLVGRYQPAINPLWSRFVWKAETYSAILHDFGVAVFVLPLVGTPYLSGFMRFLGAKIGKRAFIHTTDFTETDMIYVGDDVALNVNAPLQAHLFEDRVMKIGTIRIGDRCSVGNYSVILCDSELKADSYVGPLSLVMKGETIPRGTFWVGSPAQAGTDAVKAYAGKDKEVTGENNS